MDNYILNKHFMTEGIIKYPLNVNNVDIGTVGLLVVDKSLKVFISQAPHVCRLSILNLTSFSLSLASEYLIESKKDIEIVIFVDVLPQTKFKLQYLNYEEVGDNIHVKVHELKGESKDDSK